jgi:hypothetical protein
MKVEDNMKLFWLFQRFVSHTTHYSQMAYHACLQFWFRFKLPVRSYTVTVYAYYSRCVVYEFRCSRWQFVSVSLTCLLKSPKLFKFAFQNSLSIWQLYDPKHSIEDQVSKTPSFIVLLPVKPYRIISPIPCLFVEPSNLSIAFEPSFQGDI